MNASTLKTIGIVSMVLDHIGWILFPNIEIFHIIGKLAIPIFCYMIAEGYYKTRDVKKYFLRLLGLACISQVPFIKAFSLCFGEQFFALDTIFDLALGLLVIWLYDKARFRGKSIIVIIGALVGLFARIDGDWYIILLIFVCYKYHEDFKKMALWVGGITIINSVLLPLSTVCYGAFYALMSGFTFQQLIKQMSTPEYINAVVSCFTQYLDQIFYLLALIPIKFYNGEKGKNIKLLFYGFYPAHLIILYIIKVF